MDRILHLEDDPSDAHLIGQRLRAAGVDCEIVVVDRGETFRAEVARGGYALVISDCGLPGFSAREALDLVRATNPNLPFICLSGAPFPGAEKEMAGADDYVLKSNMDRLIAAVRRGLAAGRIDRTRSERYAIAAMRLVSDVQKLSMARRLETVQAIVRRTAREIAGADGATFILRDGDRCYYADEDAIAPLWKGQRFPMSACVSGWVMLHAQPAVITNIYEDPRVPIAAYRPTFVKSMAMVPIRSAAPIGAIGAYWARLHSATREEVELLQALANATAVTMENIQVYAELERRVEERTSELRVANAELESFSYSVSHDLRAPLRTVEGFSALLTDAIARGSFDEARDYGERVRSETARMHRLIDSLLELSRVTRAGMRRERVDLSACARRVFARLAAESPGRAVDFVVEDGLAADADPDLVDAVVENLVSNAWKYSSRSNPARIEFVREVQADGTVAFVVRDNGVGFDMKQADRLFRPFQRLHHADEYPGTGVGLATVRRIVERHGGRVSLESMPGRGTTVRFTLGA